MHQNFSEQKGPRKYHKIYEVAIFVLFGCGSWIYSRYDDLHTYIEIRVQKFFCSLLPKFTNRHPINTNEKASVKNDRW